MFRHLNARPNLRHMKCLVLCALTLLAPLPAKAQQGTVTFANNAATPLRGYGTNLTARVALYGSTQTNLTEDPLLSQLGAAVDTFTPGLFSGGVRNIGSPGDLVTLQVRAWTGGFATYEQALAAALLNPNVFIGCSACWIQAVGGGILPTPPITGTGRFSGVSPFATTTCVLVPEPSSLALAAAGALLLAAVRFRRS